jgi:hypothetical protein
MSVRLTVRLTLLRRFAGEITQQMIKNKKAPGSLNGSGLFQTIVSLKIREVYEKITVSRGEAHLGSNDWRLPPLVGLHVVDISLLRLE